MSDPRITPADALDRLTALVAQLPAAEAMAQRLAFMATQSPQAVAARVRAGGAEAERAARERREADGERLAEVARLADEAPPRLPLRLAAASAAPPSRSPYNVRDWYWTAGNRAGVAFHSRRAAWVPEADAEYAAWAEAGGAPTRILCDGELAHVLWRADLPGATVAAAGVTDLGGVPAQDAVPLLSCVGMRLTSTGDPALSGQYPVDAASRAAIVAESVMLTVTGAGGGTARFSNGQETRGWVDIEGGVHTFDAAHFVPFAEAVGRYADTLASWAADPSGPPPSAEATVP